MLSRRLLSGGRVATVGACVATLLLGSATVASAAVAPAPQLVSLDQAFAALPTAQLLPGAVRLTEKIQLPAQADLTPCPELALSPLGDTPVTAATAGAVYEPAHHQTPVEKTASWALSALVFHNAKLARAAQVRLMALEKGCPRHLAGQNLSIDVSRVHASPYSVDGWTGYRSVDEISSFNLVDGPEPQGVRLTQVYLVKGNVLLAMVEQGGLQPGTVVRQEAWRKTVTTLMVTTFDKLQA